MSRELGIFSPKEMFFLGEVSYLQTICKLATRIKNEPFGRGYLLTVQRHQTPLFVLFSLLFEVPSRGGNHVAIEPLDLSVIIFSFVSFRPDINESSRP